MVVRFFRKGCPFGLVMILLLGLWQGCSSKYTIQAPEYASHEGEINQHSRLVKADQKSIFQSITEERSFQKLCPKGTIFTYETPPPYQVGTIVKVKIDHIFKLQWKTQVEELDPNRMIRLRFLDGFFADGTELWELKEEDGLTRVTHTIIVKPKGLKKLAWLLKVRLKHDRIVEAVLDNLKKASERDD